MSVKKKRRLQLTGKDDEYAKRDAVKDQTPEAPKVESAQAPKADVPPPEAKPTDKPEISGSARKAPKAAPSSSRSTEDKAALTIQVNLRLPVGEQLTTRLHSLAEKHGQAVEPIMKTARSRAAERFTKIIEKGNKPESQGSETGGEVTRFATSYSGKDAERLNSWFDPFGLGVAKDGIKPIMTQLLQEEVAKICDAAD
ncbi:MAG: hypothetical protein ACRBBS_12935 [Thalassovita sp.]